MFHSHVFVVNIKLKSHVFGLSLQFQSCTHATTLSGICGIASHLDTDHHYCDVIMWTMASQITSLTILYSTIHSGADQRKHQSSASPAFVRGIHRWPVNSPHKGSVTRKMFPFDDIIVTSCGVAYTYLMFCFILLPICCHFAAVNCYWHVMEHYNRSI